MANVIIIVGDTGTGKSTAIRTLPPEKTAIINVLNKPLPFRGSSRMYNAERNNIKSFSKSGDIVAALDKLKNSPFTNIVLDDLGFSMLEEFFEKASVTGYDKFAKMGVNMQKIIAHAKSMPANKNIFLLFHVDKEDDNTKFKVKLIGKMLDDKYNPLATVTICLFTEVTFDKEKNAVYQFITNRTIDEHSIIIPAKSPDGMLPLRMPNDLQAVVDAMEAYYNEEDSIQPIQLNPETNGEEGAS